MRIGFVFDDTLDVYDGVQQHIVILGRELARLGHHVEYLVGETKYPPVPHTHSLSTNAMVSFNGNRMRIPIAANHRDLRAALDGGDFDVLDVQAPYSPLLAGRIIAMAGRTTGVVATYHIAPTGRYALWGGKILGAVNRRTHRRVDEVVAVSDVAADYARTTAHVARSTVIANPIDVANLVAQRQRSGAEQIRRLHGHGPHIVFISRFVARKGAAILLEAVAWGERHRILPEGLHITMAGKGPLWQDCRERAARLDTPVEFTGFVSEQDKPALLASANVAVFPATGGESFGIVLLEAIACGSGVVLAGDNPGYHSTLLGDTDALFSVDERHRAEALARAMVKALNDKPWAAAVHTRQQALLQRYDVRTVAPQMLEVYRQAVADRRGPSPRLTLPE